MSSHLLPPSFHPITTRIHQNRTMLYRIKHSTLMNISVNLAYLADTKIDIWNLLHLSPSFPHHHSFRYMVIDLKVLVKSFNCEDRSCYVGNPCQSIFLSLRNLFYSRKFRESGPYEYIYIYMYVYIYMYIYIHTDGWKSSHRRWHNRIHGILHPSQRSITGSLSSSIEAHCRDLERLGYPSPCPVEQLLVEVAAPPSSSTLAATPTPEATSTVTRQLPKMRPLVAVCTLFSLQYEHQWTSTCWVPAYWWFQYGMSFCEYIPCGLIKQKGLPDHATDHASRSFLTRFFHKPNLRLTKTFRLTLMPMLVCKSF